MIFPFIHYKVKYSEELGDIQTPDWHCLRTGTGRKLYVQIPDPRALENQTAL